MAFQFRTFRKPALCYGLHQLGPPRRVLQRLVLSTQHRRKYSRAWVWEKCWHSKNSNTENLCTNGIITTERMTGRYRTLSRCCPLRALPQERIPDTQNHCRWKARDEQREKPLQMIRMWNRACNTNQGRVYRSEVISKTFPERTRPTMRNIEPEWAFLK